MRFFLAVLFCIIPISIVLSLVIASRDRGILNVGTVLWSDPWFHATLLDAYAGFITFYVWVAYKETGLVARVVWFVLIMGLGNIATAGYVLIQLAQMKSGDGWETLLLRRSAVPEMAVTG
jgi:hypothetical protein